MVMSPKAAGTSLRGGRSSSKGFKLAVLESTIKKNSSSSSGSPTQVGSSTQKIKVEGSSTQIISIKPESSTQGSPKLTTAKQTSADYAWSIQTLQALQEMGYTYWDYVDAWTKTFWHQNTRSKHSWLIYFKTNTVYNFPNWFFQCWDFFGPIPEIFPEQRHAFVKWCFQSHPELLKVVNPETFIFLNQKSQLAAFLAGSRSKASLAKNLKEVLQMLQQEEEGYSSKKEETSSS
ncbi:hypothetical protein GmHk_05G013111 [Glycine max]|nr:hypothetical protein GmHk_05G013111 [Glycine max]